jgi:DeoR/GlpR family transcriptional regulator of sugar metabolism
VFVGANGIDPSAGLTCHSSDEAAANGANGLASKETYCGCGSEQVWIVASWQICPVEVCDLIITDSGTTSETIHPYTERGVEMHWV